MNECDFGSINKLSQIQVITMDQAVQEVQLPVMENLIKIPIEMLEISGILKERDSSEKRNQGMERQELGKQIKWK